MGIDTSQFVATGGGAKSSHWLQIKANIFGVPFIRPRITEGGIVGAAILAGSSTGVFKDPEAGVRRLVKQERVFEPDPKQHALYQEKFGKYQEFFPRLRDLLIRLK